MNSRVFLRRFFRQLPEVARPARLVLGVLAIAASAGPLLPTAVGASEIAQRPLLTRQQGEPNVMLMMDDSTSMGWYTLDPPVDFDGGLFWGPHDATGHWTDINDNSGGTTNVHIGDVTYRNPQLNPLFYNAALTYRPWNDNNKPAASNFPPADIGSYDALGALVGGTAHDPRFIQDGATRVRANTYVSDLFRRFGTRNSGICTATITETVDACSEWVTEPSSNSETGTRQRCVAWTPTTRTSCTAHQQLPGLTEARYYVLEGSWDTQRHSTAHYRLIEIDRDQPARMYPTPTDPRTGVQATRSDCANPVSCTFTEEAQNYANWFTYSRTRLLATIGVTSNVLSTLNSPMRLGYGRLNYYADAPEQWWGYPSTAPGPTLPLLDGQASPGHVVRGVRPFTPGTAPRQALFDWLFTLNSIASTPNREALDAVGKYFSRSDAAGPWSGNPGTGPGGGTADLSCRRSSAILATDGGWTNASTHPLIADLYPTSGNNPRESDGVDGPVLVGAGSQGGRTYQYVPSGDPVFGGGAAQDQTLTDAAHYYWSRDLRPDLINNNRPIPWPSAVTENYPSDFFDPATWQNMATTIVGYGLMPSITPDQVRAAMEAGTTVSWPTLNPNEPTDRGKIDDSVRAALASRGDFFTAKDPAQLAAGLAAAFQQVQAQRASGSGVAVSAPVIRTNDDLLYEASYLSERWTGSLAAIEAASLLQGTKTTRWTAQVPAHNVRRVYTSTARTTATEFRWPNLTVAQQAALGDQTTLDYLRGDASLEMPAGSFRTRPGPIGSIVHSTPLYSKATNFGYQSGPTAGGAGYATYLTQKASTRRASVMVNANDGMLHAYDALTGAGLFNYVPRAAIGQMAGLADPNYTHFYLVDGQVTEGDVHLGGAWKTVVVGTGGAGPKSLFALDVTDPDAVDASKVMFDLTAADEPDLGHVMGRTLIASTRSGKWVAITGNGYESTAHRAVLLIIDLATGLVLRKIDTGIGSDVAGSRNGLGPVTPIYNGKRDVIGLYAGDKLGNVWKFDLSSTTEADWGIARVGAAPAAPLYTAVGPGGARQPITTEIRVTQHPLGGLYVAFGTGQFFEHNDVTNNAIQSLYFLRDKSDVSTILKTSLRQATLTAIGTGEFRRLGGLTGAGGLDWATHRGWYVDLRLGTGAGDGERIAAPPVLSAGRVLFTSFRPTSADPCEGGGDSFYYSLDLATGLQRPAFDGQGTDVIGRRLVEGVRGGLVPLFSQPGGAGTVLSSIDASQLTAHADSTRYTVAGSSVTSAPTGALCGGAGTGVRSTVLAVPTACAGTLPMRVWRDMR